MKKLILLPLLSVFCLSVSAQEMVSLSQGSGVQASPVAKNPQEKPKPSKKKRSILEKCTILAFGGKWTLVPKGAIRNLPDRFAGRVALKASGKYTPFSKFLGVNRGWIRTQELTTDQIRRAKEIDTHVQKNKFNASYVVITTHNHRPVSLSEPTPAPVEESKPK